MTREADRDEFREAADDVLDYLEQAEAASGADDEIETGFENEEVPTVGGEQVDGTVGHDCDVTVHADPTEELREAEEELTRAHLAREDLTPTDRAVIQALADGGRMHYEQLVEKTDSSSSSVYRAIDRWGTLVQTVGRGTYDLADDVVREKIEDVFATLEDVTEWVERGIDAIVDGSDEIAADSPLAKWARRHGVLLDERADDLEVELTGDYSKLEIQKLLRAGLEAARDTGAKTAARFVDGSFTYRMDGHRKPGQTPFNYVGARLFCLGNPAE